MICDEILMTMIRGVIFGTQMSTQIRKGICGLLASIMPPPSLNGCGNLVLGEDIIFSSGCFFKTDST
jgi:hypothetical protein